VEQELDRGQRDVALRRVDDALGTVLEGGLEERDDVGGLVLQALGKLLVGRLQMVEVDVAIVLFGLDVLVNLVSFVVESAKGSVGGQAKAGHLYI
jgi:hypothetical protein